MVSIFQMKSHQKCQTDENSVCLSRTLGLIRGKRRALLVLAPLRTGAVATDAQQQNVVQTGK